MKYKIGDTIRLKATIKNLLGVEAVPANISVKIYTITGTLIYTDLTPSLDPATTAQYYSDWTIDSVEGATTLIALWEWTGPHKKKILFDVVPIM